MTPDITPPDLLRAADHVRGELVRVDAKAAALLTLAGTALTLGLAVLAKAHLPVPATVTGWATVAVIATAVGCLATAVRPALRGDHGFVHYARTAPAALVAEFTLSTPTERMAADADRLVWLSQATDRKYRRVRLAVDLLMAGLAGVAVTALLAAFL